MSVFESTLEKPMIELERGEPQESLGQWFVALEEMGEFIGIRYGQIDESTGDVNWSYFSHVDVDGIGGFGRLLRDRNAQIPELPRISHHKAESWVPFLKKSPRLLGPRKRLRLREFENEFENSGDRGRNFRAAAWHVFSEEETREIRRMSRVFGITVNSYLLRYLDRAVRRDLVDPSELVPWMIPVNLRGKIQRENDEMNHSSFVGIKISASDSSQNIHQKIYKELKKGQHWANWKAYSLGGMIPPNMKKQMIETDRAGFQWNIGSFSNLGDWDKDKEFTGAAAEGDWLFAPPVLDCQVIGAGCVTFRRKMSLLLQVHPSVTTDNKVPEAWMDSWVSNVKLDISQSLL